MTHPLHPLNLAARLLNWGPPWLFPWAPEPLQRAALEQLRMAEARSIALARTQLRLAEVRDRLSQLEARRHG